MHTVEDTLPDDLRTDFGLARVELAEARLSRQAKDTPAARSRVELCQARLDRILDMWLDVRVER